MNARFPYLALAALVVPCWTVPAHAVAGNKVEVKVNLITPEGVGDSVGTVTFSDGANGLIIAPDLKGLPAGAHGFHLHENPSCTPADKDGKMTAGQGAGGHYDPQKTGKHAGPSGTGHLGDLPALEVAKDGTAKKNLMAPHLKLKDIKGHSLMIHAGGDNYSDAPQPLGGGGARIACGVVP